MKLIMEKTASAEAELLAQSLLDRAVVSSGWIVDEGIGPHTCSSTVLNDVMDVLKQAGCEVKRQRNHVNGMWVKKI